MRREISLLARWVLEILIRYLVDVAAFFLLGSLSSSEVGVLQERLAGRNDK